VMRAPVELFGVILQGSDIGERRRVVMFAGFFRVHPADGSPFHMFVTVFSAIPPLSAPVIGFFDGLPHGTVVFPGMAARAQNGRVEAEYFLTAVAGNPGKRWVYIDNVVEVIGDDNRLVAAIKDAGSDAQAAFAVFPVGDVGLDYHKAGFNAFLSIDGCAVGVYPVRFAVG